MGNNVERTGREVPHRESGLRPRWGFVANNPPTLREAQRAIAQVMAAEQCRYGIMDFTLAIARDLAMMKF